MSFLDFYGLKEDPFKLSPDPVYFYPSAPHKVAADTLDYTVEHKEGFCLITGEPGTGKTTLLKVFIDKWRQDAEMALILTPRLAPEEFLVAVLDDFKVQCGGNGKIHLLKAFREFLLEKSLAKRPVIIIVDEAQNIPDDTLEELRLLSNLETEKEKLLQIILVGQPEIESRLKADALRQLDQRIMVRARLTPLSPDEIIGYMNHRLIRVGKGFLRIDEKMADLIYKYSKGIPRLINVVSSRTIMSAYLEGQNLVTPRHVKYAMSHLDNSETPVRDGLRSSRALYWAVGAAAFAVTAAVSYFLMPQRGAVEVQPMVVEAVQPAAMAEPQAPGIDSKNKTSSPGKAQIRRLVYGTVTSDGAVAKAEPESGSSDVGPVLNGQKIKIVRKSSDSGGRVWLKFVSEDMEGWLEEKAVAFDIK